MLKRMRTYLGVIFAIFARDVKRVLRNPVALVIALGMIVMPSAYAWYVVAANWDPYSNTADMLVAVANEDAGADSPETGHLDVGAQVVAQLHDNHEMGWEFTDAEAAINGVYEGRYWAALVIPKDFSEDFASVFTGDFTQPTIDYYVNEKPSSIAPKVTDAAANAVEAAVNENFVKTVSEKVVETTQKVGAEAEEKADAAEGSLTAGVRSAKETVGETRATLEGLVGTVDDTRTSVARADDTLAGLQDDVPHLLEAIGQSKELLAKARSTVNEYGTALSKNATDGALQLSSAAAQAQRALGTVSGDVAAAEAVGEVGAAADQAQAYADLVGSTTSLVNATANILKDAGKAPDATAPLVSEAQEGLTSGRDGLSAASTAAEKALTAADASYDAVARAADEAFATMKDDPAAAQGVLAACRSDVQGLAQAYQTMRDTVAGADPGSPAVGALDRIITQLGTLEANLATAESAIGGDAASIDEAHTKVTDSINQARAGLHDSMSTYNDQLKGELASLADSLQKVGADTETLAGSLKDTADSLGASTDSLAANLATAEASLRKTAETLRTAESQLAQARDDLQHALDTGDIDEVRRIIGDNPAAIAQFLAAPTHLERHAVYPMADNGSAMSPFYTSLALWIGAIFMVALMSVTVSPARQAALTKKFGRAPRPGELYLGRYGVFCLIGLAQALIVGLGNVFFLGVECEHFWLYLAACCLASVVFTNLVYTLTVSFGNIGKALAIIGLVLQLAGAGGLMPVQMLSAPLFQEIYPWLPFAHSMPALEGAMAGIYGDQYLVQMGLLAAILVPSLILGLVLRRPVIRLNDWVLRKLGETKFL